MIAAMGAFDGFHLGHQALFARARELASRIGADWGAVTFERHPDSLLVSPKFKSLYTARERGALEKFLSIPRSCKIGFTRAVADMSPAGFLDLISGEFGVDGVVVGEGFRFGKGRAGTTELLGDECRRRGWLLEIVLPKRSRLGDVVSSTAIREAVSRGDMKLAWEMQGYPFFCAAEIIHGNERGRLLGYPTANLDMSPGKVNMRRGVYSTLALARGEWRVGAANAGLNPTFDDVDGLRFEVNLLDFDGDLYGSEITVFILEHLRDEIRFDGPDALIEQMRRDADAVRESGERAMRESAELWERFRRALG